MKFAVPAYLLAFANAQFLLTAHDDDNMRLEAMTWVEEDKLCLLGRITDKMEDKGEKDSYLQTWVLTPDLADTEAAINNGTMWADAAGLLYIPRVELKNFISSC